MPRLARFALAALALTLGLALPFALERALAYSGHDPGFGQSPRNWP